MKKHNSFINKGNVLFIFLLLFIIGVSVLLVFIKPSEIIDTIGVRNGYIIVSILALLGGFSTFTSVSLYTSVVAFTIGGMNPLLLGLVAIPGLFIGDTLYYFFGNTWNAVISDKTRSIVDRFTNFLYRPRVYRWSPILIFIYVGLTPLPPEFLIVGLSFSKYPYKRLFVPLILGEFAFVVIVGILSQQGIQLFKT